jgi:hypothetical protein
MIHSVVGSRKFCPGDMRPLPPLGIPSPKHLPRPGCPDFFFPRPAARTGCGAMRTSRRKVTGNSAGAIAPTPMAPGVNDQKEEQDEAKAQEDENPRLAFKQFPESFGELTKIHALVNLHQSGHKQKGALGGSPGVSSSSRKPVSSRHTGSRQTGLPETISSRREWPRRFPSACPDK